MRAGLIRRMMAPVLNRIDPGALARIKTAGYPRVTFFVIK